MSEFQIDQPTRSRSRVPMVAIAILPLLLLGVMVWWFLGAGTDLMGVPVVPMDRLDVERIQFRPGEIIATVRNTGPDRVDITHVAVNDAFWGHRIEPSNSIARLNKAVITIPYPWEEERPYEIRAITANSFVFNWEVDAALPSPEVNARWFGLFAVLGLYVGVIPIFLGMLWLPFMRQAGQRWTGFFVAFTVGVLAFLLIDTVLEGFELAHEVPAVFHGPALFIFGGLVGWIGLVAVGQLARRRAAHRGEETGHLTLAYLIAAGIGLHNLGEGLAIGSSFVLGEVGLGTLLILGFTVHNVTEGPAIVAPLTRTRQGRLHFLWLGLLAGAPTILGGLIGGFTYSTILGALFFGIAAGAIVQVIIDCTGLVRKSTPHGTASVDWQNLLGAACGFALMYATALLIAV